MEDYKKQTVELEKTISGYQARLESVPVGIKEYDQLTRERDLAKKDYEDLDRRLNASAMSTALENRQQGERLEQLDPPSLPQTPTQPKRPLIIAIGAGIGLIVGLCLAGRLGGEGHRAQKLEGCASLYAAAEYLGSIPLLENDLAVRRRKRLTWLAWSSACLVGAIIMSGSVVYYYATKL